jgi:hypothetical protein
MVQPLLAENLRDEIHVDDNGVRKGPFTLADFKKRRKNGEISAHATFFDWNSERWRPIRAIAEDSEVSSTPIADGMMTITISPANSKPSDFRGLAARMAEVQRATKTPETLYELAARVTQEQRAEQKEAVRRGPTIFAMGAAAVAVALAAVAIAVRLEGPDMELALFFLLFLALVAAATYAAIWLRRT